MKWIKCSDRLPKIDVESIEMGEPENNDVLLRTFSASHESYYYEMKYNLSCLSILKKIPSLLMDGTPT